MFSNSPVLMLLPMNLWVRIFLSSVYPDNNSLVFSEVMEACLSDYLRYQKGPGHSIAPFANLIFQRILFWKPYTRTSCSLVPLSVQLLEGYFSTLKSVSTPAFAFHLSNPSNFPNHGSCLSSEVLCLVDVWKEEKMNTYSQPAASFYFKTSGWYS